MGDEAALSGIASRMVMLLPPFVGDATGSGDGRADDGRELSLRGEAEGEAGTVDVESTGDRMIVSA